MEWVGSGVVLVLFLVGCQRSPDTANQGDAPGDLMRQRLQGWANQGAYDQAQSLKYRTIYAECQVADQVQTEIAMAESSDRLGWYTQSALIYQKLEMSAAHALQIPDAQTQDLLNARVNAYRSQFDGANPAEDIERHQRLLRHCDDLLRLDAVVRQQMMRLALPGEPEGLFVGVAPDVTRYLTPNPSAAGALLDREVECMAKVVMHEANNQSQRGRRAVAMVMRNRLQSGKFGRSYCAVASQSGQFFDVDRYVPERHTVYWWLALRAAKNVFYGLPDETGGAIFYKLFSVPDDHFFKTLHPTLRIEDHQFYR